ncbi:MULTISPECIES: hypothetical protein [Streptomyces]|uniref:hypothetical protein n=1 Tax=Streptomyces TaxID=1883 RepID=UPI0004CCDF4C|nr:MULTISPECIES: hypothetical protein [Streptomyces]KOT47255.1 hypothetical protein ADK43_39850 [Streptomyces rimosus subsp. rimosus]
MSEMDSIGILAMRLHSHDLEGIAPWLHPGPPWKQGLDGYQIGSALLAMACAGHHLNDSTYDALAKCAYGKGYSVGLNGRQAAYVGVHLLAGHVAAESVLATCLADDSARFDTELTDGVRGIITHLWPTPTEACPPQDVRIGGRLHRHIQELDYHHIHPALPHLARTVMCPDDRYPAALRKLHWSVIQHCEHRPDRLKLLGQALIRLLPKQTDGECRDAP